MNVEHLSSEELRELQKKIEQQLKARAQTERAAAIEEIYGIAHRLGMTLNDLIGKGVSVKPAKAKVAVQYRNPSDPSQEWTGRGRQPKWVKEALESGKTLDALRV
jgi:DNA-binding protein H-NS